MRPPEGIARRVREQRQKNLLELRRVALDDERPCGLADDQLDVFADDAPRELEKIVDGLAQVERADTHLLACARNARSLRVSVAARFAASPISLKYSCDFALGPACRASSAAPTITPRRLLKSCATPPASNPVACIFCECRSRASSFLCRSVTSLTTDRHALRPCELDRVRRDLGLEGLAVVRVVRPHPRSNT